MLTLTDDDRERIVAPPDLSAELRRLVLQIPSGAVASFGDLAEALGDLQAARWVAAELQELDPGEFPIHRVVRRTGNIPGAGRLTLQDRVARLRSEGHLITEDFPDLKSAGWRGFVGASPLAVLRELQNRIGPMVELPELKSLPERVAGVDVSYAGDGMGVAAYAIVETATGTLVHHETLARAVTFPYIPGYLSFRELPLHCELLDRVRQAGRLEPWLLVDGNGILHPRRAGIATVLGCAMSLGTVGVGKHLLCGKVENPDAAQSPIRAADGSLLGYRLKRGSKRSLLYISPGQGVDAAGALRLASAVLCGHRLPEPLHHADRLSREAARRR